MRSTLGVPYSAAVSLRFCTASSVLVSGLPSASLDSAFQSIHDMWRSDIAGSAVDQPRQDMWPPGLRTAPVVNPEPTNDRIWAIA